MLALWIVHSFFNPAFAGCPPAERQLPRDYPITVEQGLAFCDRADGPLRLDLARPITTRAVPLIIFIHGGAWVEGTRDSFSWEITEAARRGFAAATIDYRVKTPFPAALNDIRCAVRWARTYAQQYGFDPWKVGVVGGSAGGHLALLAGITPDLLFGDRGGGAAYVSGSVQAVVNFFGPVDLATLILSNPNLSPAVHQVFSDLAEASPLHYLSPSSPPILTVHGTNDDTVSYQQAVMLDAHALSVGARHQLVSCWGEGHGFFPSDRMIANDHMFDFFARIFGVAHSLLYQ